MIIVACYKILDGMALVPTVKILERIPEDKNMGFDINDNLAWFRYLEKKYMKYAEDPNGIPRAFRVYNWNGHQVINFFPGVDKQGNNKNLARYGRLVIDKRHKKYMKKC